MSRLFGILTLILCAFGASANVDVYVPLTNWNGLQGSQFGRKVLITPIVYSNNIVAGKDPFIRTSSSTSGDFWVSNTISGLYKFELQAPPAPRTFYVSVPAGSGTFTVTGDILIDSATVNIPAAQLNAQINTAISANAIARSSGFGTNTTFSGTLGFSATSATNAQLYLTNYYVVTTSDDTNHLYVTQAGTVAARGIYTYLYSRPLPHGAIYIHSSGNYFFLQGDVDNEDGEIMIRASTNNLADGSSLYTTFNPIPGFIPWDILNGSSPAPIVRFGTNYTTNVFSQLQLSGSPLVAPTINRDLYVATNGSDIYWLRGYPDRPFASLAGALAQVQPGETIHIAPGIYPELSAPDIETSDVTISGSGISTTVIQNNIGVFANNATIRDLASEAINVGDNATFPTNLFLERVEAFGSQDGILLTGWESVTAWNCSFGSPWDAYADYQYTIPSRQFYSNSLAKFYFCDFISDDSLPGSVGPEPIIMGSGRAQFFNCTISRISTNLTAPSYITADGPSTGTTNGVMEFFNCVLVNKGTVALSNTIHNAQGGKIRLYNTPLDFSKVYDPSNKIEVMTRDGGQWTNVTAAYVSGGAKLTNAVVDLRTSQYLQFLGPSGGDGYFFKWFSDRLELSNNVSAMWIRFNDGLQVGHGANTIDINLNRGTADVSATTFTGSGANLTSLDASQLSTGTVSPLRQHIQAMFYSTNATTMTVTVNTNAATGLNFGGTAVLNPGWTDVTITNNTGQILWREVRGSISFANLSGTQPTGGTWFTNTVSPAFTTQPEILLTMNGQGWITSGSIGTLIANTNGVNALSAFTVGKTSQILNSNSTYTVGFSMRSRN